MDARGPMPPSPSSSRSTTLRSIGRAVRSSRASAGLTQAMLAERASLATETISRIEAGGMNISIGALEGVARALGLSIADLMEPLPPRASRVRPAIAQIVAVLEPLADDDLDRVRRALRLLLDARGGGRHRKAHRPARRR